jgi:uncharacterized membrane protein
MSTTVSSEIDVDVPVRVAYDQWTQFESFPNFMGGVDEIRQLDDSTTHWVVSIGGVKREFDAKITEQVPDSHVAWQSIDEPRHRGRIAFRADGPERTHLDLELEWEPEGFVEQVGSVLNVDDRQVKRDLERFKTFIEARGDETGAWRGEIHGGQPTDRDRGSADREVGGMSGMGTPGSGRHAADDSGDVGGATGTVPPTGDGAIGSDPDLRA